MGPSSVENIRVSAFLHSVGFTFIFRFEQEVTFFFCQEFKSQSQPRSLQKNGDLSEATQLPESKSEHRLPATDLMKLSEEAEHRVQRETQRASTETPGLRR